MFKLFMEGGLISMSILTILLVAVFFAAWKAPRWVKEIGAFALVAGFLSFILGLRRLFSTLQQVAMGNDSVSGVFDLISPGVFFGGIKVHLSYLSCCQSDSKNQTVGSNCLIQKVFCDNFCDRYGTVANKSVEKNPGQRPRKDSGTEVCRGG